MSWERANKSGWGAKERLFESKQACTRRKHIFGGEIFPSRWRCDHLVSGKRLPHSYGVGLSLFGLKAGRLFGACSTQPHPLLGLSCPQGEELLLFIVSLEQLIPCHRNTCPGMVPPRTQWAGYMLQKQFPEN